MPVTLRTPNNPDTPAVVLGQVKLIIPGYPTANTALAAASPSQTGAELIFVRQEAAMVQAAQFPAVNLTMGAQTRARSSRSTYLGECEVVVSYYDRWSERSDPLEAVSLRIGDDLERMAANLESNDSLTTGGVAYAVALPQLVMSGDTPFMKNVEGTDLVFRTLRVKVGLLDYDV